MANLLTKRGWPRPTVEHKGHRLPVPWATPSSNLAMQDGNRRLAAIHGLLCTVCGIGHLSHEQVFLFVNEEPPEDLNHKVALAMDDAVMHERCAKLTLGRCPGVRSLRYGKKLWVLSTVSDFIEIKYDHEDEERSDDPRLSVEFIHCLVHTAEGWLSR